MNASTIIANVLKFTVTVRLTDNKVYSQVGIVMVMKVMMCNSTVGTSLSADMTACARTSTLEVWPDAGSTPSIIEYRCRSNANAVLQYIIRLSRHFMQLVCNVISDVAKVQNVQMLYLCPTCLVERTSLSRLILEYGPRSFRLLDNLFPRQSQVDQEQR